METIGPSELLIILLVLVAIFGASRLPKMARGLGEGIREFRNGLRDASDPTAPDRDQAPDPTTNDTAANGPAETGDARRSASG